MNLSYDIAHKSCTLKLLRPFYVVRTHDKPNTCTTKKGSLAEAMLGEDNMIVRVYNCRNEAIKMTAPTGEQQNEITNDVALGDKVQVVPPSFGLTTYDCPSIYLSDDNWLQLSRDSFKGVTFGDVTHPSIACRCSVEENEECSRTTTVHFCK